MTAEGWLTSSSRAAAPNEPCRAIGVDQAQVPHLWI